MATQINISLPSPLLERVDLLLLDAFRGRPAYGARSHLISALLEGWLEGKFKVEPENKDKENE